MSVSSFNIKMINELFPFHFIVNKELEIIQSGISFQKIINLENSNKLSDNFKLERPTNRKLEFESLISYRNQILYLRSIKNANLLFRYQIVVLEETNDLLFAGTLWVTHPKLLNEHNLNLLDFAPHNTMTDMMQIVQSKEVVVEEMKEILHQLRKQKTYAENYKEQLTNIINCIPIAILVESEFRTITYTNEEFCSLFNIPMKPNELTGFDCSNAAEQSKHLFKNPEVFISRISELLSNKKTVMGDILHMTNGKILKRDFIFMPKIGIIWLYEDITESKKTEELILRNEVKYRTIIESLNFGLLEVDLEENIRKVYPSFCQLTGYPQEELLGKKAIDYLLVKEDVDLLLSESKKRSEGINSVYEVRMKRKNGEPFWAIISGAPLYNSNNEVIGSIGIHWDISNQKQREKELQIAKEEAEKSSKAKKDFIAKISHELRTPLNVINGMSQLLINNNIDDEITEDLETIKQAGNNLLNLVNDLLDLSKIESGKLTLLERPFELKDTILECIHHHEYLIKKKNLNSKFQLDPSISKIVIGDEQRIKQIITNILSNAIKFTVEGTITLSAKMINNIFQLIITDTGIGISQDKQKIIFEPFTQEDLETSIKFGGTGLGLSITKELVELMNGEITLKSKVNSGTKFEINLPLIIADPVNNQNSTLPVEILSQRKLKNINILVAEDNPLNQKLISKLLDQWNAKHVICENGELILKELDMNHFDIILMDNFMPILNGIDTTKRIRENKNPNIKTIPIIGLTALGANEDKAECLNAGMNAFINKPFDANLLLKTIIDLTNKKTPTDIINFSFFRENGITDKETIKEMIEIYLNNSEELVRKINQAIASNNFKNAKLEIHSLKSNTKLFGLTKLSLLLEELENKTDITNNETETLLLEINTLYQKSREELTNHLKEML